MVACNGGAQMPACRFVLLHGQVEGGDFSANTSGFSESKVPRPPVRILLVMGSDGLRRAPQDDERRRQAQNLYGIQEQFGRNAPPGRPAARPYRLIPLDPARVAQPA